MFSNPHPARWVLVGLALFNITFCFVFLGAGGPLWRRGVFWSAPPPNTHTHTHNIPARLGLKKDIRAEPAARTTRSGVVKGTCPG